MKEEKWTPHIIAATTLLVFIVLGLACASTPSSSGATIRSAGDFNYEIIGNGDKRTVYITGYTGKETEIVIPAVINRLPVTAIGRSVFKDKNLTGVTIPSSVTSIGYAAFSGCTGLTSVTIPSSVTSIGYAAFWGCTGLTSVTIPSSVTSIGNEAFRGCTGLTSVTIPSSVTYIGDNAFSGCTGLTSITVDTQNSRYSSVDGVLFNKDRSVLMLYSAGKREANYTIPSGVTYIGIYAFTGCSSLTSVTIPSGVRTIGYSAFRGCTGLTSVTIPSSVTSIGIYAFQGCTGLTSVTIPSSVTSIGDWAFYGCTGLTSVTIPSGVTSIGDWAFYRCTGLTSVTIPSSVTSIGDNAFSGCTGLTSVTIQSNVSSVIENTLPDVLHPYLAVYGHRRGTYELRDNRWYYNGTAITIPARLVFGNGIHVLSIDGNRRTTNLLNSNSSDDIYLEPGFHKIEVRYFLTAGRTTTYSEGSVTFEHALVLESGIYDLTGTPQGDQILFQIRKR